jgi:hypothetical protein
VVVALSADESRIRAEWNDALRRPRAGGSIEAREARNGIQLDEEIEQGKVIRAVEITGE